MAAAVGMPPEATGDVADMEVTPAKAAQGAQEDDDATASGEEDMSARDADLDDFDWEGLEKARLAVAAPQDGGGEGLKRKKQRGGCKDTKKGRKRLRREDDLRVAKEAGVHVPSLRDALRVASAPAAGASSTADAAGVGSAPTGSSSSSTAPAPAPTPPPPVVPPPAAAAPPGEVDAEGAAASVAPPPPATGAAGREAATPGAVPEALQRGVESYADALPQPATAFAGPSAPALEDPATRAAADRALRDVQRKTRAAEAANARTVFVTNLSFKATEQELRDLLGACGAIRSIRFSRDKATTKVLGYAHVQFDTSDAASAAVERCDKHELHGRVMRAAIVKPGENWSPTSPSPPSPSTSDDDPLEFELPEDIKEDIRVLMREGYEGKNISTIKDAWQKRHPGQKLDTCRWGFKNFSTAVKTVEGVCLETHAEKTLTNLAFFEGSAVHTAFLEDKRRKVQEREEAKKKAPNEGGLGQGGAASSSGSGAQASAPGQAAGGTSKAPASRCRCVTM